MFSDSLSLSFKMRQMSVTIRESQPQCENRIMAQVYVRCIVMVMRSTMYHKAPYCLPEMAQ